VCVCVCVCDTVWVQVDAYRLAVPDLDDLGVARDDVLAIGMELDVDDRLVVAVVLDEQGRRRAQVVHEHVAAAGAERERQAVEIEAQGRDGVVETGARRRVDAGRRQHVLGDVERGGARARARVPALEHAVLAAEREQLVDRTDAAHVDAVGRRGRDRVEEASDVEVESVDLVARGRDEQLGRALAVRHVAPELGDAHLVVRAELCVELHRAVGLEEHELLEVV